MLWSSSFVSFLQKTLQKIRGHVRPITTLVLSSCEVEDYTDVLLLIRLTPILSDVSNLSSEIPFLIFRLGPNLAIKRLTNHNTRLFKHLQRAIFPLFGWKCQKKEVRPANFCNIYQPTLSISRKTRLLLFPLFHSGRLRPPVIHWILQSNSGGRSPKNTKPQTRLWRACGFGKERCFGLQDYRKDGAGCAFASGVDAPYAVFHPHPARLVEKVGLRLYRRSHDLPGPELCARRRLVAALDDPVIERPPCDDFPLQPDIARPFGKAPDNLRKILIFYVPRRPARVNERRGEADSLPASGNRDRRAGYEFSSGVCSPGRRVPNLHQPSAKPRPDM